MIAAVERVGFGARAVAALIDAVLVLGGLAVVGALGALTGVRMDAKSVEMNVLSAVVLVGYFGIEAVAGWTPGKRMRGLMIAATDGRRADPHRLAGRWLVKDSGTLVSAVAIAAGGMALLGYLSTLLTLVVVVGCFLTFGASRQALHDRLARTAVFRTAALERLTPGTLAQSRARAAAWLTGAGSLVVAAAILLQFAPSGMLRPGVKGLLVVVKLLAAGALITGVVMQRRGRPSARPAPEREAAVAPEARAPIATSVDAPPAPRPASAPARPCPTCGAAAMERGRVIGWYCNVCGTRTGSA